LAERRLEAADNGAGPPPEAGLVPSFAGLAGERVNARALARARVTWLRLIEDMSQGRPLVARALWRRSLGDGELPDVVEHGPPDQPGADALAGLSTEDLFLLTALAVHGELDGPSLVEVLNVGASRIRGACRRLQAQGILISDEDRDRYEIEPLVHPLVLRLLRQRAFLVTA
ncbi:MAG TPA: hypothetical protein PKA64_24150, partial [Myxococcota bacterium]|nr:hypothetical protein [Myxococcota bacterium]